MQERVSYRRWHTNLKNDFLDTRIYSITRSNGQLSSQRLLMAKDETSFTALSKGLAGALQGIFRESR